MTTPGALRHHEPGARGVERPRRPPSGRRSATASPRIDAEAREDQRVDAALRPAREHGVGVAAPDQLGALADRVRPGRAGGDDRVVRPADPELDRELAARPSRRGRWRGSSATPGRARAPGGCRAGRISPLKPPMQLPTTIPTRSGL